MTTDELNKMMAEMIKDSPLLQEIFCGALSNVEGKECDVDDVVKYLTETNGS